MTHPSRLSKRGSSSRHSNSHEETTESTPNHHAQENDNIPSEFDVAQDPIRLDGLLPNRRSAHERQQSFLYRKSKRTSAGSHTLAPSSSSSSLAFSFCASDSASTCSSDNEEDDERDLLKQIAAASNKTALITTTVETSVDEAAILKIKTQEASLEITMASARASTTSSSFVTQPRQRYCVRFDTITIHYHQTILGDNPSVSSGAPIALGWQRLGEAETYTVEAYEQAALPPARRRTLNQLKLGAGARQRRLQQAGVHYIDIVRRIEICDQLRFAQYESIKRAATSKKKQTQALKKKTEPGRRKFWKRFLFFTRA